MNHLLKGLQKIVNVFEEEGIQYMIVGGFAVNFYNRVRFTADIDIVIQIYPRHVDKIVKHFPDWIEFSDSFQESARQGIVFNITDFETGVKYDFMLYKDSDYNWTAFERRREVDFLGITCNIAAPEDLILSKLKWYDMSKSEKQAGDIAFLLNLEGLDVQYVEVWSKKLNLKRHGFF